MSAELEVPWVALDRLLPFHDLAAVDADALRSIAAPIVAAELRRIAGQIRKATDRMEVPAPVASTRIDIADKLNGRAAALDGGTP